MSAVAEGSESLPIVQVLFCLFPNFDTLDVAGPLEVLSHARHDLKNPSSIAFKSRFVAAGEHTVSAQGASFRAHMDYDDAIEDINDFDILIVPGGDYEKLLKENAQPIGLIKAFIDLQQNDPSRERTIMTVSTGSFLLAQLGALQGLAATTHPDFYTKFEILCQEAARRGDLEQTDVMEDRYVVVNGRYELGENEEENPFVFSKRPARPDGQRKSSARKGSFAFKDASRRESVLRRANLKLAGLRVITAGGISAGLDAALYLVGAMVTHESAEEVARVMQYSWNKGVTVDGLDV